MEWRVRVPNMNISGGVGVPGESPLGNETSPYSGLGNIRVATRVTPSTSAYPPTAGVAFVANLLAIVAYLFPTSSFADWSFSIPGDKRLLFLTPHERLTHPAVHGARASPRLLPPRRRRRRR